MCAASRSLQSAATLKPHYRKQLVSSIKEKTHACSGTCFHCSPDASHWNLVFTAALRNVWRLGVVRGVLLTFLCLRLLPAGRLATQFLTRTVSCSRVAARGSRAFCCLPRLCCAEHDCFHSSSVHIEVLVALLNKTLSDTICVNGKWVAKWCAISLM